MSTGGIEAQRKLDSFFNCLGYLIGNALDAPTIYIAKYELQDLTPMLTNTLLGRIQQGQAYSLEDEDIEERNEITIWDDAGQSTRRLPVIRPPRLST